MVARAFDVEIAQRGNALWIGPGAQKSRTDVVEKLLLGLLALVQRGFPLHATDVDHAIRIQRSDPRADLATYFSDTVVMGVGNRPISPRTPTQRRYVDALRRADIVFGVGPAGTGKTYLAMAMAVSMLLKNDVRRIILTRPAVEAGEKLGFLPGDLTEKIDPYLRPLYDALQDMVPAERLARLNEKRVIEVAPLAFMRGRTLNDAFVILDEAQNTTVEQMKMFLTRLGESSRMVITGDVTQIDLPSNRTSGLVHALRVLKDVERIEKVWFGAGDVVRHPLVASIIEAYDAAERERREPRRREGAPEESP
jgi:phosphate starvation-inducible PhoH-like protein